MRWVTRMWACSRLLLRVSALQYGACISVTRRHSKAMTSTPAIAGDTAALPLYTDAPPRDCALHVTLSDVTGRVVVVGDPHGCYDEFEELLAKCNVTTDDTVIVVGDLVNKGPKSLQMIRKVMAEPNFYCVRGNHDDYSLMQWDRVQANAVDEGRPPPEWVKDMSEEEARYLRYLPFSIALPHLNALDEAGERWVGLSRDDVGEPWIQHWNGPEFVLFGHDAKKKLQRSEHAIGLDTGCCYGFSLSAMILPEKRLEQVDAHEVYSQPGKR